MITAAINSGVIVPIQSARNSMVNDLVIPYSFDDDKVDIIATGEAGQTMIIIWGDGNVTVHEFTGGEDTITNSYSGTGDTTVVITGNRAAVTEIDLGVLDPTKGVDIGVWFPNTSTVPDDAILAEDGQPLLTEDDLHITLEAA